MGPLLLKLLLTPALIAIATLVQRRWGHAVGGRLVGLPLTSAPMLLLFTLGDGPQFAVRASTAGLGGQLCVAAFCLGYARAALSHRWPLALSVGICCFAITALAQNLLSIPLPVQESLVPLGLVTVLAAWPVVPAVDGLSGSPRWELPARMLVAVTFILLITESAALLGSQLAGLIAPFPVFAGLFAVFTHHSASAPAAVTVLRGVVTATFSASVFFLTVAMTLLELGTTWSFLLALVATVIVNVVTGLFINGSKHPVPCIGRMNEPELASRP